MKSKYVSSYEQDCYQETTHKYSVVAENPNRRRPSTILG
jgi:hypothetical protein